MKIYCINLERREDRKKKMIKRLKATKIPYEFIIAHDREDLVNCSYYLDSHGQHSCLLSHIKALETFKESSEDIGIILEDDVILTSNIKGKLEEFIKTAPANWNMLYLGFLPPHDSEHENGIYRMNGEEGAFGYMVKREFLDKLITQHKKMRYPSDTTMARTHSAAPSYGIIPMLVMVESDYSDISEMNTEWPNIEKWFEA